jgi:uncharacterized protein YjdB
MSRLFTAATAACLAFALAACSGDGDAPSSPDNGGGTPASVSSVAITPATATVVIAKNHQLNAVAKEAAGCTRLDERYVWATSAAAVATVDANGLVTGVAVGTANITASSEGSLRRPRSP